jgi:hypothetical protein
MPPLNLTAALNYRTVSGSDRMVPLNLRDGVRAVLSYVRKGLVSSVSLLLVLRLCPGDEASHDSKSVDGAT